MEDMEESIRRTVLKIVSTLSCVPVDAIRLDADFDSLGMDILDIVEVVMMCEAEYEIEISDSAMDCMSSVADIVAHIKEVTARAL